MTSDTQSDADLHPSRKDPRAHALGWVLVRSATPETHPGWEEGQIGRWTLSRDPALPHLIAPGSHRQSFVHALGVLYDVQNPQDDPEKVLARLLRVLREKGEDAFLDALDPLGGRHLLFYAADRTLHVVTDAAATRQLFYHDARKPLAMGSHTDLVAAHAKGLPYEPIQGLRGGYPGLTTDHQGVLRLTPNTRLSAEGAPAERIERYWPRGPVPIIDTQTAMRRIGRGLKGTASHLIGRHPLALTLTGGLGSRLSLAFFGDDPDLRLLSYHRKDKIETDKGDREMARRIAKEMGRPLAELDLRDPERQPPKAYQAAVSAARLTTTIPALPWFLSRAVEDRPGTIHLRSELSEISRGVYLDAQVAQVRDAADLARLHLSGEPDLPMEQVFDVIERFRRFDAVTGFFATAGAVEYRSLFYWEHRMASRTAGVIAECDAACETVVPYNCRMMIKAGLAAPLSDRSLGLLHKPLVQQEAPRLAAHPVDGRSFQRDPRLPKWMVKEAARDARRRQDAPAEEPRPEDHPDVLRGGRPIGRTKSPGASLRDLPERPWTGSRSLGASAAKLSFDEGGFTYDLLFSPLAGADRLFVFFSGDAMRSRYDPPVFQRWSWASRFPGHCLYVADPACRLDDRLGLAWYAGTEGIDPQPVIARVVSEAAQALGVPPGRVVTYGSSGGGFAALRMLRALPEATAVTVNPQTDVTAYEFRNVERYLDTCMGGRDRATARADFPDRLSLLSRPGEFADRRILFLQNTTDLHHLNDHYAPFCASMGTGTEPNLAEGRFRRILFEAEGGHGAAETDEALETALAILTEGEA